MPTDGAVGDQSEVVLPCADLDETMSFVAQLGFRLATIMPADDPTTAVVVGHGLRLRLEVVGAAQPTPAPPASSAPAFELTRSTDTATASVGRAGMRYRDLLPTRQGGRVIASHIGIDEGGPVQDYVHHHGIRFQVIYCRRGWVRVVYEDQGPAFVLEEGDCVLQPPHIRHRVLESSPGLEVVEVTCPAQHATHVDHDLVLPTSTVRTDRDFGGQRFVRHCADHAEWEAWRAPGFEARDTRIGAATDGLAGVRVVRAVGEGCATTSMHHDDDLQLWYVTRGTAVLAIDGGDDESLAPDDAVAIPAGLGHALVDCSPDLELLEVTLSR